MSSPAQATLGEKVDSVETVRKAFGAERHASTTNTNYMVHEVATAGFTLREFVDNNGVIFAVAWQGISHPDLVPILGNYFEDFKTSRQQLTPQRGRSTRSEIRGSNVVVIKSGHMRAVRGKAYIIDMLPEGVTANDIQ